MMRGQFTTSHGFKRGDLLNVYASGTTKTYRVVSVDACTADLKPYRWYHRLWDRIKGFWS